MLTNTQNKIISIMSVFAFVMIAGITLLRKVEQDKIALLLSSQQREKAVLLDKIIEMKSASLINFAYDYTFWKEMIRFLSTGNKKWANENIVESMSRYQIDAVWVFRSDFSVSYATNRIHAKSLEALPFPNEIMRKIVSNGHIYHFYMMTDHGLMEISGASIHMSADKMKKTPPRGYFFAGRLWTNDYLDEIAKLSDTRTRLAPIRKEDSFIKNVDLKEFVITVSKAMKGWDGSPVIIVCSSSKIVIASKLQMQFNVQYMISILFAALVIIFISYLLLRLISRPLKLISGSLKRSNPEIIRSLLSHKNEFGELAVMINEFYHQKDILLEEVAERKRAEGALKKSEAQSRALAKEKANLLNEVNHRVGNNLALIRAVLSMELQNNMNDEAREVLEDMQSRIGSMAKVHEILCATEWDPLSLRDLAEQVIHGALSGSPIQDEMKVTVTSPEKPVQLTSKQAVKAALIFNELTTNCIKYAFQGRNQGGIAVRIAVEDDPESGGSSTDHKLKVKLEFHDNGAGWPEDVLNGKRIGTGLRLIGIMVRDDLEGELVFRNENGAVAEFTLMIDPVDG